MTALNTETYQWYKDGIALTATTLYSGEKTSTLTIYDIQLDDEGLYHCVADNSLNVPAASATAQLMTQRLAGWWKAGRGFNRFGGPGDSRRTDT